MDDFTPDHVAQELAARGDSCPLYESEAGPVYFTSEIARQLVEARDALREIHDVLQKNSSTVFKQMKIVPPVTLHTPIRIGGDQSDLCVGDAIMLVMHQCSEMAKLCLPEHLEKSSD